MASRISFPVRCRRLAGRLRRAPGDLREYRMDWAGTTSLVDALRLMHSIRHVHLVDEQARDIRVQLRVSPYLCVTVRARSSDAGKVRDVVVLREHLPPWDIPMRRILDAGAGTGLTTADFLCRFPETRVVCVEARPELRERIERNCAAWADRLTVVSRALWDQDGVDLDLGGRSSATVGGVVTESFVLPEQPADFARQPVTGVSLAALCREHGPFDFAKIDIEGSEDRVLAGIADWAWGVESLAIELHPGRTGFGVAEATALLEGAGYEVTDVAAHRRRPFVYARRRGAAPG